MGEAKRRKKKDPTFGKIRHDSFGHPLRPDYGLRYIEQFGVCPFNLQIEEPSVVQQGTDWYVSFNVFDCMGTLELMNCSEAEAIHLVDCLRQAGLKVEPRPDLSYITGKTREKVIPFRLVSRPTQELKVHILGLGAGVSLLETDSLENRLQRLDAYSQGTREIKLRTRQLIKELLGLNSADVRDRAERSPFLENIERIKEIGQELNRIGGHSLMSSVCEMVPAEDRSELDCAWDGIGIWKW